MCIRSFEDSVIRKMQFFFKIQGYQYLIREMRRNCKSEERGQGQNKKLSIGVRGGGKELLGVLPT